MLISVQRPWHAPGVHVACDAACYAACYAAWHCEGGKRLSGGTFDGRMPVRIRSVHFGRSAPSRRRWVLSTRIRAASVRLGLAVRPVPAFAAGRLVRDCVRSWGQLCLPPGARRCSPGPGRLQLHVVRRRGQAVAVLLMSVLGRIAVAVAGGRRAVCGPGWRPSPGSWRPAHVGAARGVAVEFIVDPRGTVPAGADAEHGLCESSPAVLEESA